MSLFAANSNFPERIRCAVAAFVPTTDAFANSRDQAIALFATWSDDKCRCLARHARTALARALQRVRRSSNNGKYVRAMLTVLSQARMCVQITPTCDDDAVIYASVIYCLMGTERRVASPNDDVIASLALAREYQLRQQRQWSAVCEHCAACDFADYEATTTD